MGVGVGVGRGRGTGRGGLTLPFPSPQNKRSSNLLVQPKVTEPMSPLDPHAVIQRQPAVLFSMVGDEVVIMDVERGEYYGLDPVGSDIWQRLATPMTPAQLVSDLVEQYDGTPEAISRDTFALLERLAEKALILPVEKQT